MNCPEIRMPAFLTETEILERHTKKQTDFKLAVNWVSALSAISYIGLIAFWSSGDIMTYAVIAMLFAAVTLFVIDCIRDHIAPNQYCWLPIEYCENLIKVCKTHPELESYRQQVIAHGRQFTYNEAHFLTLAVSDLNQMKAYNQKLEHCKALYTA